MTVTADIRPSSSPLLFLHPAGRALLAGLLLATPSAWAQLTATASFTFHLNPLPADGSWVSGGGVVGITCAPVPYMGQSVRHGYDAVDFYFEQAPAEPRVHRVAHGSLVPYTQSLAYGATTLPWGARLYPRLVNASCVAGTTLARSNLVTLDNPAVTIPPFLASFVLVTDAAAPTKYIEPGQIPVGAAVRVRPSINARPKGGESVAVILKGPGIDSRASFASVEEANRTGLVVTAAAAGPVSLTAELEPYGAVSNARILTAVVVGGASGGAGATGGPVATDGGKGGGEAGPPSTGCTAVPGLPLAALALVGLGWRRAGQTAAQLSKAGLARQA